MGGADLPAHRVETANYPVVLMGRVLAVGTSSFYDWQARRSTPSARSRADAELTEKVKAIHTMSRPNVGRAPPRRRVRCSRKGVERLMRLAGIQGLHRRKFRAAPGATPAPLPPTTW